MMDRIKDSLGAASLYAAMFLLNFSTALVGIEDWEIVFSQEPAE